MTARTRPPEPLAVDLEAVLPAPPDTVFRALTWPDLFVRWMGPEGAETVVEEMDVTVGGSLAFRTRLPGGPEVRIRGRYLEIEPPGRLVHTWEVGGDPRATTVAFTLLPHPRGTRLQLTHTGFDDALDAGRNDAGWRHQLDRLEALVARSDS